MDYEIRHYPSLESRATILAKQMDNTNATNLCRDDFDKVYDKLIPRYHDFKADIEAAMKSSVSPETMTMQEIYLKMASMVSTLRFKISEDIFHQKNYLIRLIRSGTRKLMRKPGKTQTRVWPSTSPRPRSGRSWRR